LLGILSETDIARVISTFKSKTLRSVYENIGILFSSFKRNSTAVEPALVRVQDIFAPNPTIIEKGADLAEAAKIMVRQGINGMPVVESLEERTTSGLIGIVSKTDIVNALAEIP
jgi:CBS domain-containing protein